MNLLSIILVLGVSLLFIYIMYLETIVTNSEITSKVFNISIEQLSENKFSTLMKNQGIYNGLIGFMLILGLILGNSQMVIVLLLNCILVSLYGGFTSNKKIILKQGLLPLLALLSLLF